MILLDLDELICSTILGMTDVIFRSLLSQLFRQNTVLREFSHSIEANLRLNVKSSNCLGAGRRRRTCWRDHISHLSREYLGMPPKGDGEGLGGGIPEQPC